MKYERLTEKAIGCFGYDLKNFEHKPKEFNDYDAFYAYKMAVKRLGELEDKIESGELDYVADSKTEQTITDLLIEFDEMGFAPTTVCENPEQYAIDWRERVRKEFTRLTEENDSLTVELEIAQRDVENLTRTLDEANDEIKALEAENAELREKLSNSIDTEQIAKYLAERFDCPCNISPIDEEMYEFCEECNSDESKVCWEKVIARLKEIKEEI